MSRCHPNSIGSRLEGIDPRVESTIVNGRVVFTVVTKSLDNQPGSELVDGRGADALRPEPTVVIEGSHSTNIEGNCSW